jgi:hypothetical protein
MSDHGNGARPGVAAAEAAPMNAAPATAPEAAAAEAAVEGFAHAAAGAVSGHLAGIDDEGRLLFRADGCSEAVPVSIGVQMSDDELAHAAWVGRRALAVRTMDLAPGHVLIALVRERVSAAARDAIGSGINVKVDGEEVRLTARKQIEFRCGKARLLLRQDGRIELSGTYLLSRSRGPVKIKGATIALN